MIMRYMKEYRIHHTCLSARQVFLMHSLHFIDGIRLGS